MSWKSRGNDSSHKYMLFSRKLTFFLCIGCFCAGMFFTSWISTEPEEKVLFRRSTLEDGRQNLIEEDSHKKAIGAKFETSKTHTETQSLDKTISGLEMELASARATQESLMEGSPVSESSGKRKYLMVVGINTAFSSRKRRDSVRATWMPQGEKRRKLEEEKGIVMKFVIGHSATVGGILDRAIEAEDQKHGDFLRLPHVEGYLELSAKTKIYFSTAAAMWDAEFYVKVDDDVHVNIGTLASTLIQHRSKPRIYIGCMKSGPVLAQKGVRYHEPEHWKFGDEGNRYFRHATGQLYAVSKDLATYISINKHVLHKFANEDVSIGAWFIGLDVQHIDDRRLCCGTPPVVCISYQIVSGKLRQAMSVLPHLTGAVVASASQSRGWARSTDVVAKASTPFGIIQLSNLWLTDVSCYKHYSKRVDLPTSGRSDSMIKCFS